MQKIYVVDNSFIFNCLSCGVSKKVRIKEHRNRIKIKCKCGESTRLELNRRKEPRKDTDISATLSVCERKMNIKITNLSLHGYQLEMVSDCPVSLRGWTCVVEYVLPNTIRTLVREEIVVVSHEDSVVRAKVGAYVKRPEKYSKIHKDKGFWLMS